MKGLTKHLKRSLLVFLAAASVGGVTAGLSLTSEVEEIYASDGNPYPETYTDAGGYHPSDCKWWVWEEARSKYGVYLPYWGKTDYWYTNAKNSGYTVIDWYSGYVPPNDSILNWATQYGAKCNHVAWVVSADSNGVTLKEGNTTVAGTYHKVITHYVTWSRLYSDRGMPKCNILVKKGSINNPTWTNSVTSATDNNLGVSGRISFSSSKHFSKAGFQIWDAGGNLLKNFSEAANHNSSYMDIYYKNVRNEIGVDLKPGTTYTYQYYAVADGQTYYSSKYTAKTTGTSTFNPTWEESLTASTSDNLKLRGTIKLPSTQQFQKAGIKIWDNNGNVIKDYEENTTVRGTYMHIDYDLKNELGLSLKPGTYYNYQFRATVNNTVYQSPVYYRPTAWPDSTVNHGDFYGFIMNSTWNPLRAETDDNVVLGRETNGTFSRTIWYFKRNSDGSYTITSLGSGKALEVTGGANENNANVRVWSANGSNAQKWFVYRVDGKDVFKPACTNVRIMDVSGGSTNEGANIIIYDNHNTENQRFSIYKINEQTSYSIKADNSEIKTGQSTGITINDTKYAYNFKLHIVKPDGSETVVDNGEKNTYTFTETTPGTYKIYAEVKGPLNTAKGSANDKYCEIKVKPDTIAVEKVEFALCLFTNKTDIPLNQGESKDLGTVITPRDATNQNVRYTSSAPSVVSVDSKGNVTGLKAGTSTITATTEDGGKTATCTVTVKAATIDATRISLDKKLLVLDKGKSGKLKATVKPSNTTNKTVTWSSSNTGVAKVDKNGNVTAVNHGTAKITAKTSNGKTAECEVRVNFIDVTNPKDWYYKPVYWAAEKGITTGTDGKFFHADNCTREQAITFLWRMAGKPNPKNMTSRFSDVKDSKRYSYKAIMWGNENGIITGTDGKFYPTGTCTREQIVTMLWRLAGKPEPKNMNSRFKDVTSKTRYSYKAVMWAQENGITTGTNGLFFPTGSCKRREIVTFIYRYKN